MYFWHKIIIPSAIIASVSLVKVYSFYAKQEFDKMEKLNTLILEKRDLLVKLQQACADLDLEKFALKQQILKNTSLNLLVNSNSIDNNWLLYSLLPKTLFVGMFCWASYGLFQSGPQLFNAGNTIVQKLLYSIGLFSEIKEIRGLDPHGNEVLIRITQDVWTQHSSIMVYFGARNQVMYLRDLLVKIETLSSEIVAQTDLIATKQLEIQILESRIAGLQTRIDSAASLFPVVDPDIVALLGNLYI